ncbi:helix-turn-helix domain-containing protein [Chromobacterium subtsugae]|uniref:helix-turn-helix domain-containing protein n=1 Tax=Chromobacterium subtsugae TaxID=251747 RepID=UPI00064169F0|nr:helix-turn-helix transcriptional regulator [Chromobacterium subtsugae]
MSASPVPKRLKEARKAAKLTQERLGILAGIDEESASARMNQYERGKHEPDFLTLSRIAAVLEVPAAYFYTEDNDVAELLILIHRLLPADRRDLAQYLKGERSARNFQLEP